FSEYNETMHYCEVAPTKIARAGDDYFTYKSSQQLKPGHIVEMPLGKQVVVGLVLAATSQPSFDTKEIIRLVQSKPIPVSLVRLSRWLTSYYATPLATVLQTVLPRGVAKQRRAKATANEPPKRKRTNFVLNPDQ